MPDINWKSLVGTVAPALATAFGTPAAGAAVAILSNAIFGRDDASEGDIATAIAGGHLTAEQVAAIRKADNDFKVQMAQIAADSEKAYIADTDGARKQTVALAQTGSAIAWAPVVISALITVGFFACIVLLFVYERDWTERQAALLNMLFGALVIAFGQVCNYWLGSSAGSKQSADSIRKIAELSTK